MRYGMLFFVLFVCQQLTASVNMTTVLDLFGKASKSAASCNQLHAMTAVGSLSKNPVLFAYHAAAEMIRANHAAWPQQKLGHFNAGKMLLETASKDVEMRYIRYCVQRGRPFFLGCSSNKAADRQFLFVNHDKTDWPDDYKKEARDHLNSSS